MYSKNNIEHGVFLEAQSLAEFSRGGYDINFKTKKARIRYLKTVFGSSDKKNFKGDELILPN